jgi:hypothetical protein
MAVTELEVGNWAVVGTKDAMARTYAAVQLAIEGNSNLQSRDIEVFLQGSYANATNIRGDGDVDIVVMLKSSWIADTTLLSPVQKQAYDRDHHTVSYGAAELRRDTIKALTDYFDEDRIDPRDKCIRVNKTDGYVDADVVPAIQHRVYVAYDSLTKGRFVEGTKLFTQKGPVIINYPKLHKINGIAKHRDTRENFKPTVRQAKHLKRRAVSSGKLDPTIAPGYLLECMIYNAPDGLFTDDHTERLTGVLRWLVATDLTSFKSVDSMHELFKTDPGKFSAVEAKSVVISLAEELVE